MKIIAVTAALLAFTAAAAAQPAAACSYAHAPEAVGDSSAQFLAREMVRAAAHVDLVLVEDDGVRPLNEAPTGVLTVRSIARLKGSGPDRFSVFGSGLTTRSEADSVFAAPLQHFTREDGRVTPFPYNEERQGRLFPAAAGAPPPAPGPLSSCSPPELAGQTGRFYLVMRGADGRVMDRFPLYGEARTPAFGFVPVRLEQDGWLRAVVMATGPSEAGAGPVVLHLREGADPARVEAALRRSGLIPVAAYLRTGEWVDEVRPSDEEARAPWLTRAAPLVSRRGRPGLGDPHHGAAEFLRGALGFAQTHSGGQGYQVAQAFIASVRRRQAAGDGAPRLFAVAVSGPAAALEAAAREPFSDGLRPLSAGPTGLPELPGGSEAERFAALQAIERNIWLLNGGGGNRSGTLP